MAESHRFGDREPFTLGAEEELFLVEPSTGAIRNVAASVLDAVADVSPGKMKSELHACHVELITGVCATAREAADSLTELRRRVLDQGIGLIGSGTHPAALEGEAQITKSERYELISDLLGDAAATPVAGLHIHVGMPDPETAILAFNGLRRHLPLLEALGANSPFRHGRDTGLASAREITIRGWPRSGAPRHMESFEDFVTSTERLTAVAGVPDYTYHWWKLRPHPRLGTVEIRALDAQATTTHTAALAALIQCLARHEATADEPTEGPPSEILEEASYRAARAGTEAELPDADGRMRGAAELMAEAVELARPHARELDCEAEVEAVPQLLEVGGGAGLQRAAYAGADIDGVLRRLMTLASGET